MLTRLPIGVGHRDLIQIRQERSNEIIGWFSSHVGLDIACGLIV